MGKKLLLFAVIVGVGILAFQLIKKDQGLQPLYSWSSKAAEFFGRFHVTIGILAVLILIIMLVRVLLRSFSGISP